MVGQVHSMYLVESTFWKLVPETVEGWVAKVSTYRDPAQLYVGLRERFVLCFTSEHSTLNFLLWKVFNLAKVQPPTAPMECVSGCFGKFSAASWSLKPNDWFKLDQDPLFLIPIPSLPTDFCPLWWIYVGFLDGFWQNVNNAFFNEFSIGEDALSKRREARDPNDLMFSNRRPALFCQLTVFLFI